MRLPLRSWSTTLGKLGLRIKEPSPSVSRKKAQRRFSLETLEPRQLLTVTPTFVGGLLTFTGDGANDTITVAANGGGNVTLNGTQILSGVAASSVTGIDVLGGAGHDTIDLSGVLTSVFTSLTNGSVEIDGEDGNDTITGTTLNDVIEGGAGNDLYKFVGSGALGSDTLTDSGGSDTLDFSGLTLGSGSSGVVLGSNSATIDNGVTLSVSFSSINHFIGTSKNDVLRGNSGNNSLTGGAGDDTYIFSGSSFGSDTIVELSSGGSDTLDFSGLSGLSTNTGVTVDLGTNSFSVGSGVTLSLDFGSYIENIVGSNKNDTLTGNGSANRLEGGAGDDTLEGGTGNDAFVFFGTGALGSDTITDSGGSDTLDFSGLTLGGGSSGVVLGSNSATIDNGVTLSVSFSSINHFIGTSKNDVLRGNSGNNSLTGGAGDDTYLFTGSSFGSDTIVELSNGGSDTLDFSGLSGLSTNTGVTVDLGTNSFSVGSGVTLGLNFGAYIENVVGTEKNDTLTGNALDNALEGGAGNDLFLFTGSGALGNDTITDSGGSDTLNFSGLTLGSGASGVVLSSNSATVNNGVTLSVSFSAINHFIGTSKNDVLRGNAGNNSLTGGAGDDTYVFTGTASLGTDTIIDSSGTDTLDFSGLDYGAGVTIDLASTSAAYEVINTGGKSLFLNLSNTPELENAVGTQYADTLTGNSLNNRLEGGAGNDALGGGTGDDTYVYRGTSDLGSDTIVEAADQDVDTLDFSGMIADLEVDLSSTSSQVIAAGLLTLTLSNAAAFENVTGGSGNDTIAGNSRNNTLRGGAGNDTLSGVTGNNRLFGNSGNDRLSGGDGDDYLHGGAGYDAFSRGEGNDTVVERDVGTTYRLTGISNMQTGPTTVFENDLLYAIINTDMEYEAATVQEAFAFGIVDIGVLVRNIWDEGLNPVVYTWLNDPERFFVDPNNLIIWFEDWEDGDNDDQFWYVGIEEIYNEDPPGEEEEEDECECEECGDVGTSASGAAAASSGATQYRSDVNPHPIVRVTAALPIGEETAPDYVTAQLTFGGITSDMVYYDPTGFDPGDQLAYALQVDASALATGRYSWTMTLTYHYGEDTIVRTFDGRQDLINRSGSEFGVGWWHPELDRLLIDSDIVNLVTGSNQMIQFVQEGNVFIPESSSYSAYVLVKNFDDTYTLAAPDGSRKEFDANGLLTQRIDRSGNTRTYLYDDEDGDTVADELVEIIDHVGRSTTFSYTTGKVTAMTDFAGAVTTYAYADGRMISVTQPDPDGEGELESPVFEYEYDPTTGLLTLVRDARGLESEIFYDSARRVSSMELACGGTPELNSLYSQAVVDLTEIGYDDEHLAPAVSADSILEYAKDAGGVERHVLRDGFGNVIQETNALGVVTKYERDQNGRITKKIEVDPDGLGPIPGRTTQYTHDDNGNLIGRINPDGSTESWTYEATFNKATSYTDQLGRVTLYEIDPATGNLLSMTRVVGEIDDGINLETDDVTTSYTYTDGTGGIPAGLILTETDPLGRITTYDYYDGVESIAATSVVPTAGLLKSITYADGTADETTTTYEYDARDNMSAIVDGLGRRTAYLYDALNRMVQMTEADPDGAGELTSPVWMYQYDANGNRTHVTDPLGNTTEYVFDVRNRVFQEIGADPDGEGELASPVTEYLYDCNGNVTSITDPLGRVTTYVYDALDRLVKVISPDPDGEGELTAPETNYIYDVIGRLITVIDAVGAGIFYQYDVMGRVTEVLQVTPEEGLQGYYFQITDFAGLLEEQLNGTSVLDLEDSPNQTLEHERVDATLNFPLDDHFAGFTDLTSFISAGWEGAIYIEEAGEVEFFVNSDSGGWLFVDGQMVVDDNTSGGMAEVSGAVELTAGWHLLQVAFYNTTGNSGLIVSYDTGAGKEVIPASVLHQVAAMRTTTYDAAGQVIATTDALGRTTTYEYDDLGRLVKTTLPDPDGVGGEDAPVYETEYNKAGRVIKEIDALGNETTYVYDNLDRVKKVTYPDPDGVGGDDAPEVEFEYDDAGQLVSMTDALERTTTYQYDGLGRQVKVTLPDPDGVGGEDAPEYETTYDAVGNVLTQTDALGNVTTFEYDNLYRQTKVTLPDPDGVGGDDAPEMEYVYNAAGQLVTMIDALDRETTYEYDGLGRQVKMTLPDPDGVGGEDAPEYETAYDAAGRVLTQTDALGNVTAYEYDLMGRMVKVTQPDPDGVGGEDSPVIEYEYDLAGQTTKMIDALDRETTYEYDHLGRTTKITQPDPDGAGGGLAPWTTYTYDAVGNVLSMSNRLNQETTYEYDNLYRLIAETNANEETTSYTYDLAGNRLTLTDPEENTTTWVYDGLNRVIEETNELNDTRYFAYDAVGNLVEKTDRNGRVTEYEFDNLYRLVEERWKSGISTVHTISYDYDLAGQMAEVADAYATYGYNYDGLGRQTQITMNLANLADEVGLAQAFDANSRRTSLAASIDATDDFLNGFVYDNLGRLTRITQQGQMSGNAVAEKRADFTYRADGSFDTMTRYADIAATDLVVTSTYSYDLTGRLTSLSHAKDTTTFAGYAWTWDAANRITSFTNSEQPDEDATYDYDATGQLTDADYDSLTDEEYTYDDNGNRTNVGYSTGDNNQLLSDGTFNYTYDDEGNRLTRTRISSDPADDYKTEYEWDHRNRLTKVTFRDNGNDVTKIVMYRYDALNRWIGKQVDNDGDTDVDRSESYVYDGNQIVLRFAGNTDQQLDDSDLKTRYLWGPMIDQLLADEQVTSLNSAGDVLWAAADHQNTIRDWLEYDSGMDDTTVVDHVQYDSFGNRLDVPAIDTFFGYTGRAFDGDTNLQNNWHRWYDANVGRWISEDPIGFMGGDRNLSRYVNNTPVLLIDPSGFAGMQRVTLPQPGYSLSASSTKLLASLLGARYFNRLVFSRPFGVFYDDVFSVTCPALGERPDVSGPIKSFYLKTAQKQLQIINQGKPLMGVEGTNICEDRGSMDVKKGTRFQMRLRGSDTDLRGSDSLIVTALGTGTVTVQSDLSIEWCGDKVTFVFDSFVTWTDEIDFRDDLVEGLDKNANLAEIFGAYTEELLDLIGDKVLAANYQCRIAWHEVVRFEMDRNGNVQ